MSESWQPFLLTALEPETWHTLLSWQAFPDVIAVYWNRCRFSRFRLTSFSWHPYLWASFSWHPNAQASQDKTLQAAIPMQNASLDHQTQCHSACNLSKITFVQRWQWGPLERGTSAHRTRRTDKVPHIDAGSHFVRESIGFPAIPDAQASVIHRYFLLLSTTFYYFLLLLSTTFYYSRPPTTTYFYLLLTTNYY